MVAEADEFGFSTTSTSFYHFCFQPTFPYSLQNPGRAKERTNSMVAKAGESEMSTISTGFLSLSFPTDISKQPTKTSESQGEDKFLGSSKMASLGRQLHQQVFITFIFN